MRLLITFLFAFVSLTQAIRVLSVKSVGEGNHYVPIYSSADDCESHIGCLNTFCDQYKKYKPPFLMAFGNTSITNCYKYLPVNGTAFVFPLKGHIFMKQYEYWTIERYITSCYTSNMCVGALCKMWSLGMVIGIVPGTFC